MNIICILYCRCTHSSRRSQRLLSLYKQVSIYFCMIYIYCMIYTILCTHWHVSYIYILYSILVFDVHTLLYFTLLVLYTVTACIILYTRRHYTKSYTRLYMYTENGWPTDNIAREQEKMRHFIKVYSILLSTILIHSHILHMINITFICYPLYRRLLYTRYVAAVTTAI